MKKYFFDEKYSNFTKRLFAVISIVAFCIGFLAGTGSIVHVVLFGVILAGSVQILYFAFRWVLKALPDSEE